MRVLKDKIFLRTKAYNVPQLIDFICTRLEGYYERKIQLVANGRYDNVQTSKFMPQDKGIKLEDINKVSKTIVQCGTLVSSLIPQPIPYM